MSRQLREVALHQAMQHVHKAFEISLADYVQFDFENRDLDLLQCTFANARDNHQPMVSCVIYPGYVALQSHVCLHIPLETFGDVAQVLKVITVALTCFRHYSLSNGRSALIRLRLVLAHDGITFHEMYHAPFAKAQVAREIIDTWKRHVQKRKQQVSFVYALHMQHTLPENIRLPTLPQHVITRIFSSM